MSSQLIGEDSERLLRVPGAGSSSVAALEAVVRAMDEDLRVKEEESPGKTQMQVEAAGFKGEHYIQYVVCRYGEGA